MTLDDVVTMLLAEAIRTRTVVRPHEWRADWDAYESAREAGQSALRAGWVYR